MKTKKGNYPTTPEMLSDLKLKDIPEFATGFKAIKSTMEHISREAGIGRGLLGLNKMNQKGGFDCPGCAWPDPDGHRSNLGEYCENGAKALAEEATTLQATPEFFKNHRVSELLQWTDYELGKSGRITEPMILEPGDHNYKPISWNGAFKKIADELNALPSPDDAIFYTSGRTSNEAAFLHQLFVRQFGTNNLPDCSNMCHESSGSALSETIGIGKATIKLDDFSKTDLVIIMGQNPGTNHPRMLSALEETKRHGGKIIAINPLPEVGLLKFKHPQKLSDMLGKPKELTDIFLQVKINGDVALLKAILLFLINEAEKNHPDALDREFIQHYTENFDLFLSDLKLNSIRDLVTRSGVPYNRFLEASELILRSKKIIICWAMGLTQHKNAVDNVREAVNLLLLKGSIGIEGGGVCPVRGHSNVQGDRTMGIWEVAQKDFLDKLGVRFQFSPPYHNGYDVVRAIKAMERQKGKVFIGLGGNFISATPDTELTANALRNCKLTVQVSTKPNRSHLVHGDTAIILPCLGRSDKDLQNGIPQFVSVENSMGIVHSSQGNLQPVSKHLMSEPMIIARLAQETLGPNATFDWVQMASKYDLIRDAISEVIPGFEDYNRKVRQPAGFYLPNGPRERKFTTPSGKAQFTTNKPSDVTLKDGEFIMMTIRSHDQYNTTIYGLDDRYRGIHNERRVVLMNREDLQLAKIPEQSIVDLQSDFEGEKRVAKNFIALGYDIPRGCVATYFPEANVLVPINNVARKSNTPASKSVVVSIRKRTEGT
ncbi:FdhF/YdeP family oxidoreductase [Flavobacteriaceae bacterium F89]|uniref:FdhF/YdeP family oxidoreductase n=1 Tax=Cerina litoralis TaxID=2874477 RepID=A0AAE3ES91_9FLAO|nr:FdhF/YdeP family oxidoreductase [Cerina litoralis]MCG2459430.1 FdhF/YdeP family oxidoreductase [Cerina litoralis]